MARRELSEVDREYARSIADYLRQTQPEYEGHTLMIKIPAEIAQEWERRLQEMAT